LLKHLSLQQTSPIDFCHPLAVADHQHINYSRSKPPAIETTAAETPTKVKAAAQMLQQHKVTV
jgi:hypothetical protein